MSTNEKKILIAGAALLAVVAIGVMATRVMTGSHTASNQNDALSAIYGSAKIEDGGDHYLVDSKEVFSKKIQLGGKDVLMVTENGKDGSVYRFYTPEKNPKLLKEVDIFGSIISSDDIENTFFEKDITGDGIPELFVRVQTAGNNLASYEVLEWKDGAFVNLKFAGEKSNLVEFDEITSEKNGQVAMTWHGVHERGRTTYSLSGVVLTPIRSVSLTLEGAPEGGCIVGAKDWSTGAYKVLEEKQKCDVWTEDFSPYFSN